MQGDVEMARPVDDTYALACLTQARNDPPLLDTQRASASCSTQSSNNEKQKRSIKTHLSCTEKAVIYGKVTANQSISTISKEHNVSRQHIYRLAKNLLDGGSIERKQGSGRPTLMTAAKVAQLKNILESSYYDQTYESLGQQLKVSPSTIMYYMKKHKYRYAGKYLRPVLTEHQMCTRLVWAQAHLQDNFHNCVDLDEKIFVSVQRRGQLKLPPGISAPRQAVRSKRFITQIMVMTAIARPNQQKGFSGLVGIWPFTKADVAKRSSKNRPAGAAVLKTISVTGEVWGKFVAEKVFPAIRKKMYWHKSVTLQIDNAKPHSKLSVRKVLDEAGRNKRGKNGMSIGIESQPANSPDTNCNDLGFYSSLDKAIGSYRYFDLQKLQSQVEKAFWNYDSQKLEDLYKTKQMVVQSIYENHGKNTYKLPHGKKPPCNKQ